MILLFATVNRKQHDLVVLAAPLAGGPGDPVVDAGDVAAGLRADTEVAAQAAEQVGPDERRGVPDVGDVVRRDAARVDAHRTNQRQRLAGQDQAAAEHGVGVDLRDPPGEPDDAGGDV